MPRGNSQRTSIPADTTFSSFSLVSLDLQHVLSTTPMFLVSEMLIAGPPLVVCSQESLQIFSVMVHELVMSLGSHTSTFLSSLSKVHFCSRSSLSLFRARCSRTLTFSTVIPTTSAISLWLNSITSDRKRTVRSDSGSLSISIWTHSDIWCCSNSF